MSEMIEKVAKAIFESSDDGAYNVMSVDDARRLARAAIEAMREPTQTMFDAAATVDHGAQPGEEWEPMIEAALRDKVGA